MTIILRAGRSLFTRPHSQLTKPFTTSLSKPPNFLPSSYEFLISNPSTSPSREATISKFKNALQIQRAHPDFLGVPLEGVCVEFPGRTLRVLEWTSYEGHMYNFRQGPSYPLFLKAREGAYLRPPQMTHYSFLSPLTQGPVVEYMSLPLLSATQFPTFSRTTASLFGEYILPSPGALGFSLGQQTEDPSQALALLAWEDHKSHTHKFRESQRFPEFRKELERVCAEFVSGGREGVRIWHVRCCEPGEGVGTGELESERED
ncbi:hypothetical protein DACRYDRAFT_116539 [Dacryopinax primogenitus]|uniref:ABM domain-containing protein n=1 Tax=Dacryopinax primogenitus (strain DJM 731) TaxID=1858805 RepID=M5FZP6_DACPD|nr:uncharacterized protein DACRYDRAFT_116539 [Dacryopinax primogenitus]EJU01360.1 hypothetical protein DACRYDRAFT_116539 [Dacryopinax primogenitus]